MHSPVVRWLRYAVVLALATVVPAYAGKTNAPQTQPIYLLCADLKAADLCQALTVALLDQSDRRRIHVIGPDDPTPAKGQLIIGFQQESRQMDGLSGHLIWGPSQGTAQAGPTLTVTVNDAVISPDILQHFADSLVQHSEIPS